MELTIEILRFGIQHGSPAAKKARQAWQSDACRLLRAFLEQPHVSAVVVEQDPQLDSSQGLVLRMKIPRVSRIVGIQWLYIG